MSKAGLALTLLSLILLGCKGDDEDEQPIVRTWSAEFLVADATYPRISPDGSAFLFLRDGDGLFLWHDGVETRVTPEGITARPDYSWSVSGENRFAFSIPGLPGGEAGIVVSGIAGSLTQIWDRGSSPVYNATLGHVYCAGPENSEAEAGIWRLSATNETVPVRLTDNGLAPQIGDYSTVLAYIVPSATSNGGTFTTRRLTDLSILSEVLFVSRFQCAVDSSTILIEIVANSGGLAMPPAIYRTAAATPAPLALVAEPATNMRLLKDGSYLYNQLVNDQLGALVLQTHGYEFVLSDTLYSASANNSGMVLAAGQSGITRLTEN